MGYAPQRRKNLFIHSTVSPLGILCSTTVSPMVSFKGAIELMSAQQQVGGTLANASHNSRWECGG
jgi:hypothetical protein